MRTALRCANIISNRHQVLDRWSKVPVGIALELLGQSTHQCRNLGNALYLCSQLLVQHRNPLIVGSALLGPQSCLAMESFQEQFRGTCKSIQRRRKTTLKCPFPSAGELFRNRLEKLSIKVARPRSTSKHSHPPTCRFICSPIHAPC